MTTYEHLVQATLPYGLMPLCVPQLKTITLGGAVTGLGIESASFRSGLPHESVIEMDILTGAGEILTVTAVAFFPPAAVLSAVTPIVVKIRLEDLAETGTIVGSYSAIGTAGAIFGTFFTGFVLLSA